MQSSQGHIDMTGGAMSELAPTTEAVVAIDGSRLENVEMMKCEAWEIKFQSKLVINCTDVIWNRVM